MQQKTLKRAERYAVSHDYASVEKDDIRAKSPTLFVVLGSEVKESIGIIKKTMDQKIVNAKGAAYFYIGLNDTLEEERVVSLYLPFEVQDEKTYRSTLSERFLQSSELLCQLGEKVTQIKNMILEQHRLFRSWEQLYISVVCAAGDPVSVLLPDITVLLKQKLSEDFKQVFIDLFAIVDEGDEVRLALRQAMTMSLFKELDDYQEEAYRYLKPIEILPGNISINMAYEGPLFELIYVLTDRKENGQKIKQAKQHHYETLCYMGLLKNRYQKNTEGLDAKEQYNSTLFRHNIFEKGQHRYASCNVAKVKRPGIGIYMAAAYHLYKEYMKTIMSEEGDVVADLLDRSGLSEEKLNRFASSVLKGKERLKDIYTLMSNQVSFKEIKNKSFKDAEIMLYHESCEAFFEVNFRAAADTKQSEAIGAKIKAEIRSPYAISELFKEPGQATIRNLREQVLFKKAKLETLMKEKEQELVGQKIGTPFTLFDKKYLRDVKEYLIDEIYELKYKILFEDIKLKQIDCIKTALEALHEVIEKDIKKLENVGLQLKGFMEEANRFEEEYLVQNVNEYYQKLVASKIEKLKKSYGSQFFSENQFMGDLLSVLEKEPESFFEKLFEIEEKYILSDQTLFNLSFEEELLERANISAQYENEKIVAKTDLYEMLYESLEENSKACVYLDTTQVSYRYEEKYFFADRKSEFITYAYERDKVSRNYKLGCVHDEKKSSIEKIQLIGGFKLTDLILTRSAARYYEVYKSEGYRFHGDRGGEA